MDASEEMKKWVGSLSTAEKRFIKLLGKARSGVADSQQLNYFDWLNHAAQDELIPVDAKFANNLPTVSNRLKDLILDGLRLLNKEANIDAQLRTTLDEIAILRQKDLQLALSRQLRRAKKAAIEHSRYSFALQCIKIEQQIAQSEVKNTGLELLESIRQEEIDILQRQSELHELEYHHSILQARGAQILQPRRHMPDSQLATLAQHPVVHAQSLSGNYLEKALAVNILGIVDLLNGTPEHALPRYQALLQEWSSHPAWQNDQPSLLFFICNCYQSICFCCPMRVDELEAHLALIPDFKGVGAQEARDFQRMLYHNQFNLTLNLGQLDRIPSMIAEIDRWIQAQGEHLTEARILPFWHNFMLAEFIIGDLARAKRRVQSILNLPQRKVREDIREFALLMQAVLQSEMGDSSLSEYLVRAGKRHFNKYTRELAFELSVLQYLEKTLVEDESEARKALDQLMEQLTNLAEQSSSGLGLLGLTEMLLWGKSKQEGRPLKEIFLEAVQTNLAQLGW